jgi:hypothetical protein
MGMILTLSNDGGNQWIEFQGRWTFENATNLLELFTAAEAYEGWDANLENDDEEVFFAAYENDQWVWINITEMV